MTHHLARRGACCLLVALLAGCTGAPETAGTRLPGSPVTRGFGVAGVEGNDLPAMLARCERPASDDLRTRCAQLRRTMGTQPGNTVAPAR